MSQSRSYRLQAPRPRQPPPSPLHFTEPTSLLYDLPSMTPPTSPQSKARLISPTSPTFSTRRGAPTPPPSARNRSSTPSAVAPSELETFAVHCRAWYFSQDEDSGRQMTQTMSTLPASQRAPFARLQASIRADYHRSVNTRKNAEFQAHISAMQPGASLNAHSRADPHSALAKKERYERMERFISGWCTMGMPGTLPFFEALWAVLRLQVIPENLGGAGAFRIQWEFDDAVFKEAAGREFMFEAIDLLKGVLAFEEVPSSKGGSPSSPHFSPDTLPIHSRSQSQPLPSDRKSPLKISSTVQPKRARAPSDPFLDSPAPPSSQSASASASTLGRPSRIAEDPHAEERTTMLPPPPPPSSYPKSDIFEEGEENYMRIWTSPDLPNPELLELLKLFPSFVSRRPLPRFANPNPNAQRRRPDIEEGEEEDGEADGEGKRVHFGTGSMWVSERLRADGWEGGWWTRFVLWWRRMFCC